MFFFPGSRIRHPFFPQLAAAPARRVSGRWAALAGTVEELERAASRGAQARRAIFVLMGEDGCLGDAQRDRLWRIFQVPVYALRMADGRAVAWECEAQDGMHVEGAESAGKCACGRKDRKLPEAAAAGDAGPASAHARDFSPAGTVAD